MKKQRTLTGYMFGVNAAQIALAFAIYALTFAGIQAGYTLNGLFFGIQGLIWLIFGYIASLGTDMTAPRSAAIYSLLSIAPISVLLIICAITGFLAPAGTAGWAQFFFFGAPLSFYLKPAVFLNVVIKNSAYIIYAADVFLLLCASFVGALIGNEANKKKLRDKKHAEDRKETKSAKHEKAAAKKADEKTAAAEDSAPPAKTAKTETDKTEDEVQIISEDLTKKADNTAKIEPKAEGETSEDAKAQPETEKPEKNRVKKDAEKKTVGKKNFFNTVKKQKQKKNK